MIQEYFKKTGCARIIIMLFGNIFLGMGIAFFKLSVLGNDPYSGMMMALAEYVGISYANFQILLNLVFFAVQLAFGRYLIGAGTLVNALGLGYIVTFFYYLFTVVCRIPQPELMWQKLLLLAVGVIIASFGLSLYQSSDAGVAPYDSLSLIMTKRWPKIPYFWCRISNDAICALVCFLAGGIVGLGTLVTVFGFGPVIHFFNVHFTNKLLLRVELKP